MSIKLSHFIGQYAAVKRADPGKEDQRLGNVARHGAIPSAHQRMDTAGLLGPGGGLQQRGQQIARGERNRIVLYPGHGCDIGRWAGFEEVLQTPGAIAWRPPSTQIKCIFRGLCRVVGIRDHAARRIENLR